MNALTTASPALPLYALLPSLMVYAILVAILVSRSKSAASAYLVLAIAIRLAMSATPQYSFAISPLGLSWNAVMSCAIIAVGALVVRRSNMLPLIGIPVAVIMLTMVASGLINGRLTETIEPLTKFAYFAFVAIAVGDAFRTEGAGPVLTQLLFVFILPFVLQIESLALGVAKATETDGSASYIGGYNHEAAFSVLLISGLLVAALNQRMRPLAQIAMIAACLAGILLANYRTAVVAMAPLIVGLLITASSRSVIRPQRPFAVAAVVLAMLAAVPLVGALAGDRYDTLQVLVEEPGLPFKDPLSFTVEEKRVMSGRAYIWAEYFAAWEDGTQRQHLVGFGANAWEDTFPVYAHNTLVSSLYELGYLGVLSMLGLWAWMLWLAARCRPPARLMLLTAHVGFILLNMATMPFWMIEGLLLYALLCGATAYNFMAANSFTKGRVSDLEYPPLNRKEQPA